MHEIDALGRPCAALIAAGWSVWAIAGWLRQRAEARRWSPDREALRALRRARR